MNIWEKRLIYGVYFAFFTLLALICFDVHSWELKTEGRRIVQSKECSKCLADFAGCMDLTTRIGGGSSGGTGGVGDPQILIDNSNDCVEAAEICGKDNKCNTRIVRDKEK